MDQKGKGEKEEDPACNDNENRGELVESMPVLLDRIRGLRAGCSHGSRLTVCSTYCQPCQKRIDGAEKCAQELGQEIGSAVHEGCERGEKLTAEH